MKQSTSWSGAYLFPPGYSIRPLCSNATNCQIICSNEVMMQRLCLCVWFAAVFALLKYDKSHPHCSLSPVSVNLFSPSYFQSSSLLRGHLGVGGPRASFCVSFFPLWTYFCSWLEPNRFLSAFLSSVYICSVMLHIWFQDFICLRDHKVKFPSIFFLT